MWDLLDAMYADRPDLHDRIERYKDKYRKEREKPVQDKTLESCEESTKSV